MFPHISKKSRRASHHGRMVSQFVKRLSNGEMIDRTQTTPGSKMRVTVEAPKALRGTR
jgi:hypothetical protein